jgi:predicted O-methyltransferase YrrM
MDLKTRANFTDLINEKKYRIGAEIGVRTGAYSKYLVENSNLTILFSIDPWETNPELRDRAKAMYATACENLKNSRCKMLKNYNEKIVDEFKNESFDFVYIDAQHDYDSVKKDIANWYPKLTSGGCLAGHDYCDGWPGVKRAVNEFCKENDLQLFLTGIGDKIGEGDYGFPSWYFFKKS